MREEFMKIQFSSYRKYLIIAFMLIAVMQCIPVLIMEITQSSGSATFDKMFLSNYREVGFPFLIMVFWGLALWHLLIYNNILIKEFESGTYNLYLIQNNNNKYYIKKILSSFIIGFMLILIFLIINFTIWIIVDWNNPVSTSKYLDFVSPGDIAYKELAYPYYSMIKKILLSSIFSGLLSIIITNIVYIFRERKYVYVISFFSWFYFMSSKNFNIALALQPYIKFEHGVFYALKTLLFYISITIIFTIFTYIYLRGKDEI